MASPSAPSSKRSSEGINFLSQLVRTIAIRKADEDLEEMERGLRIFRLGATHAKDIPEPELQATSTSNTTRIGFFNLPRELRDEIYNHLWTSLPHLILSYSCADHLKSGCDISPAATDLWSKIQRLCLPQPGTDVASADVGNDAETTVWYLRIKACYDIEPSSSEQFSSPPAGISANKQLLQEALWAFHRKGVVQFENFFQGYKGSQYIWESSLRLNKFERQQLLVRLTNIPSGRAVYKSRHTVDARSTLTPFPIRELRVDLSLEGNRVHDDLNTFWIKIEISLLEECALASMVYRYERLGSPKSLKIYFKLAVRPDESLSRRVVILSQLRCLSKITQSLDRLEMVVDSYKLGKHDFPSLPKSLRVEMTNFGEEIVPHMKATSTVKAMHSSRLQWRFVFAKV
jgi:hypothetical protein